MRLLCFLFLMVSSGSGWAKSWPTVVIPVRTPVYSNPAANRIELYLPEGSRVQAWPVPYGSHIQMIRFPFNGRWLRGYVHYPLATSVPVEHHDQWAVGLGLVYAQFNRAANSFTDSDQVAYTTSVLTSRSTSPQLILQTSDRDFWRLILSYKAVHYTGTATSNASPSPEALDIKENFVSVNLQTAWSFWTHFYVGLGAEAGKAISTSIVKGGVPITLSASDYPVYAGPQAFLGTEWAVGSACSIDLEGRYEAVASQSPLISDYEVSALALYWL